MSINQQLTALLLLVQLSLIGQSQDKLRLEPYFQGIEKLVDKHRYDLLQDDVGDRLLAKKENSSGAIRVQACLDLFTCYIFKSIELAKQYNDEAYRLSADSGYNEGFLTAVSYTHL